MSDLTDRIALVTGGGAGIGAACSQVLAGAGATVIVADRDRAAADVITAGIVAEGGNAVAATVDVADSASVNALVKAIVAEQGRLDIGVNNAGIGGAQLGIAELTDAEWVETRSINMDGVFFCMRAEIQQMKKQGGGGAIVNTTSGVQAGVGSCSAYAASKGGVASLTYCWAMDAAADGIRVNSISPVATSAMTETSDEYMRQHGQLPEGNRPFVDPACNAPAVAFLLSNASSHLNGQILRVHGEQLQLISHPAVLQPVMERDTWDIPSIAKALKDSFGDTFPPLGLTGMRGEFVPLTKVNPVPR